MHELLRRYLDLRQTSVFIEKIAKNMLLNNMYSKNINKTKQVSCILKKCK